MSLLKQTISKGEDALTDPWRVRIVSFSEQESEIRFKVEYRSETMTCPVCGVAAEVVGREPVAWEGAVFCGYRTHVTAWIPVIGPHAPRCRVTREQSALTNTLLLDLILKDCCDLPGKSPFRPLFDAVRLERKTEAAVRGNGRTGVAGAGESVNRSGAPSTQRARRWTGTPPATAGADFRSR